MRLREFQGRTGQSDDLEARVLTALEFLRNRAHNKKVVPIISTAGFLNLVNNAGGTPNELTFDTLMMMRDKNDALKNLIKDDPSREQMQLRPFGDEPGYEPGPEDEDPAGDGKSKDPTRTVDAMAKKAASKRS